jgi:hypothetical protein
MALIKLTPQEWYAANPRDVKEWGVYALYAAEGLYALKEGDTVLSYNATYFQKSARKNGWGRYANWYFAYTPIPLRRQGYAKALYRLVEQEALDAGLHRLKSLVQSDLGYYLHRSLNHQFWGIKMNKSGHLDLVVDTPIADVPFPEGIPTEVRTHPNAHLLTPAECEKWMMEATICATTNL